MYASFLGKTVGAKAVAEPERRQENGDLWNLSLRPRYSKILQEEWQLLSVKINLKISFIIAYSSVKNLKAISEILYKNAYFQYR